MADGQLVDHEAEARRLLDDVDRASRAGAVVDRMARLAAAQVHATLALIQSVDALARVSGRP